MNVRKLYFALPLSFIAAVSLTCAQTAHYPAGVEGIKAGTLPPPGLYLRDYNYLYFSNDFSEGPPDFNLFAYVQAPRLIWISDWDVLGGFYGADVLVPFAYQDVTAGGRTQSKSGLGDVFVEPVTLSWHKDRYDLGFGYGFWAPTGQFDTDWIASPGKGYWGNMFTAGATAYFDKEKTWSLSVLNRYELNSQNSDTQITPGDVWTLEYGLAKTFNQTVDVGLAGYYVLQTTKDSGSGAMNPSRQEVFGVGPEMNVFIPNLKLFASVRVIFEIDAQHRPQGQTINFTLTKIL